MAAHSWAMKFKPAFGHRDDRLPVGCSFIMLLNYLRRVQ
jgi:hypothetical protein